MEKVCRPSRGAQFVGRRQPGFVGNTTAVLPAVGQPRAFAPLTSRLAHGAKTARPSTNQRNRSAAAASVTVNKLGFRPAVASVTVNNLL